MGAGGAVAAATATGTTTTTQASSSSTAPAPPATSAASAAAAAAAGLTSYLAAAFSTATGAIVPTTAATTAATAAATGTGAPAKGPLSPFKFKLVRPSEQTGAARVGGFRLGMALKDALRHIRHLGEQTDLHSSLGVRADVMYHNKAPLQHEIIVTIKHLGISLLFEPHTQMLVRVEVNRFDVVEYYIDRQRVFASTSVQPTFRDVYKTFGFTTPGDFDRARLVYTLHYPGISFMFPIPEKYIDRYGSGSTELPIDMPDHTTPVCKRFVIHTATTLWAAMKETKIGIPLSIRADPTYFEPMRACAGKGLYLWDKKLRFDEPVQDVITNFGRPRALHHRRREVPLTTSAIAPSTRSVGFDTGRAVAPPIVSSLTDYFLNYFSLGIDVLVDGERHTVKAFVLHTNVPDHENFDAYRKCNFTIEAIASQRSGESSSLLLNETTMSFSCDDTVDVITAHMGHPLDSYTISKDGSPFGPVRVLGYDLFAVEVTASNHISTVTLFARC